MAEKGTDRTITTVSYSVLRRFCWHFFGSFVSKIQKIKIWSILFQVHQNEKSVDPAENDIPDDDLKDEFCDPENPVSLSFREISAAAYKIRDGVSQTPCTVHIFVLYTSFKFGGWRTLWHYILLICLLKYNFKKYISICLETRNYQK